MTLGCAGYMHLLLASCNSILKKKKRDILKDRNELKNDQATMKKIRILHKEIGFQSATPFQKYLFGHYSRGLQFLSEK